MLQPRRPPLRFEMLGGTIKGSEKGGKWRSDVAGRGEAVKKRGRETSTSQRVLTEEMTSGHPEASGLAGCRGKPCAHLMTLAWSTSHRFVVVVCVFFSVLDYRGGITMGW